MRPKLSHIGLLFVVVAATQVAAVAANRNPYSVDEPIREGVRLQNATEALRAVFPSMTSIREEVLLPLTNGGTSLTGLVSRLLGEAPSREYEGLRTKRYMYHALENSKMLGHAHGSSFELNGQVVDVFVFFDRDGIVRQVNANGLPPAVAATLSSGGFLKQFEGRSTEDFEFIRGRRGRVLSKGEMLTQSKRPSGEARIYFDRILRSVRFNAAFMDVAHFITNHPDLADKTTKDFPEEIQVTKDTPQTGPEAFARAQTLGGSPIDGKPLLLQDLRTPSNETRGSVPTIR